jgi:hypothetical protein
VANVDKLMVYPNTAYLPAGVGCYVERTVLNVRYLQGMITYLGLPRINNPHRLHCTVIYSPNSQPTTKITPGVTPIRVTASKVDFWEGHDKEGYLVLLVDPNKNLQEGYRRWVIAGCVSTHPKYEPHVTLVTPCKISKGRIEEANRKLQEDGPVAISLSHERLYAII